MGVTPLTCESRWGDASGQLHNRHPATGGMLCRSVRCHSSRLDWRNDASRHSFLPIVRVPPPGGGKNAGSCCFIPGTEPSGGRSQIAQDVVQDTAVLVVGEFIGRIDSAKCLNGFGSAVTETDFDCERVTWL